MKSSEDIGEIIKALAAFAAEVEDPERDREGQVRGRKDYKYATLDGMLPGIRKALSKHGLVLLQGAQRDGVEWVFTSRVAHVSGEWVESEMPLVLPADPQQQGSMLTYLRRYTLQGLLALASAKEDDDGASAKASTPDRRHEQPDAKAARQDQHAPDWDNGGRQRFFARSNELGFKDYDELVRFCNFIDRPRPSVMDEGSRNKMLDFLATEKGAAKFAEFMDYEAKTAGEGA